MSSKVLTEDGFRVLTEDGGFVLTENQIPQFPQLRGQTYPAVRTLLSAGLHQQGLGGQQTDIDLWPFPRYQYSIPYSFLKNLVAGDGFAEMLGDFENLVGFVNDRRAVYPFYYEDPDDCATSPDGAGNPQDQIFGQGDGTTVDYQLVRTLGGYDEPVYVPNSIPIIKVAGTPTLLFSLGNLGALTFDSAPAPGALLTWSGFYLWICKFDKESVAFSKMDVMLYELKALTFKTLTL